MYIYYCINAQGDQIADEVIIEVVSKLFTKDVYINIVVEYHYVNQFYNKCSPKLYQFLIDNGLEVESNDPLFYACSDHNYRLINYLLNNGMEMDADILEMIFININREMINILIKHDIDLSNVPPATYNQNDAIDITRMEENGLDKNVLIGYLMEKSGTSMTSYNMLKKIREISKRR